MKETTNRKKWVKKMAIAFFTAMFLLTFFSNTIMNHSLAQVSTEEIVSDSVSARVRGTGMVTADSETPVKIKESREVKEILVREGDEVKKGDVLIRLNEGESNELEEAKKSLTELKAVYEDKILLEEIDASLVSIAENGGISRKTAAEKLSSLSDASKQTKARSDEIQMKLDAIENGTDELAARVNSLAKEVRKANEVLEKAQHRLETEDSPEAEEALEKARQAADDKTAEHEKASEELEEKKNGLTLEALSVGEALTKANEEHQRYLDELLLVNSLKEQYEDIKAKEKEIETLKANQAGDVIKAAVDGKVTSINVEKGELTVPDMTVLSLQEKGKGYSLRISVTKEQAAKVSKGDEATLSDAWYYGDLKVTLAEIKADPENPSRNKLLVFRIDGDVEPGQNMSVSVGEKSSRFDYVVPNNAVREDNNGKFILIIREKSSPLGNRYVASRVNITVLRSDDAKSAVSGPLEGGEYVITTSNKMVKAGDYVRLSKQSAD